MSNKIPLLIAGAAVLCISVLLLVQSSFASSHQGDDIQDILDTVQGLPFDEFIDASYKQILLRNPETVTSMGISQSLGIRDDRLDIACNAYVDETYQLKAGIYEILSSYDRSELDYDQQINYDSYSWVLSDWEAEREYMYHFYPVTYGFSRQNDLFLFFADKHPLETLENVEDYISRLAQIDDQFACLIQNLADSEARGIVAPAQMLQEAVEGIADVVPGSAADLSFYTILAAKIEAIAELSVTQREDLLAEALQTIDASVIPAYQALVAALEEQIPRAPEMNGVWQLPDGDAFYEVLLRLHTTTELSAEEIHQRGLDEVERISGEIWDIANSLGYPADETMTQLFERIKVDSGLVPAADIVPLNEGFIQQAQQDITEVFNIEPKTGVIIIPIERGGFYVPGSLDGSRPGAYYMGNGSDSYRYWMRTITYHETIPGHHFQVAIGNEQDVPLFIKGGEFNTAFIEGWGLYSEYLVMEMGWYDDDIYSKLGRLQWELLRAVRMVVDTGLHHHRWSRHQAIDYYEDTVGMPPEIPGNAAGQIDTYLYMPGRATAYKIGMMKILELRQHAMDELGDLFNIKDFHRAVLLHNSMPLPLLERVVEDYIELAAATRNINYGLAGGWFDTFTPGQGFLFDFLLDSQYMFVAAFIFDDYSAPAAGSISGSEQRWFTAEGNYSGNRADLTIYQTRNGVFDDPAAVSTAAVGSAVIEFNTCTKGSLTYDLPGIGLSEKIPLSKLLADEICTGIDNGDIVRQTSGTPGTDSSYTTQESNYGLIGGWYNTTTPGQGFLFDFLLDRQYMFVAAFTFDTASPQAGGTISGAEQRWFTAEGNYSGNRADLTIYQTRDSGVDSSDEITTTAVGTMTIEFASCTTANLTHDLPEFGLSGIIPISKLLADEICTPINDGDILLGR
jgi:uncharacterized protein (DUF885 family)